MTTETPKARPGLVIVDHGTRSEEANARLGEFASRVAQARPEWLVTHAHMELGTPDLASAIESLVERGVREVFVHTHFLVAGFHVNESIPRLLEQARDAHPGLSIRLGEPLGEDPRLVEIVVSRLDAQGVGRGSSSAGDEPQDVEGSD